MAAASFSPETVNDIRAILQDACKDKETGLPVAGAVIVGDGHHAAHNLFEQIDEKADVYWFASCTKLVTSIACLQLVEKGVLSLDDPDQIEQLCPELRDIMVATEDGDLVEKTGRITLRMLLTHTSGFGYSFLCPALDAYAKKQGFGQFDETAGREKDFHQPLVNQPGQAFQYGISHDWVGITIERATGLGLNEYMSKFIFQPLGITELTMFPDTKLQSRIAGMWHRNEDGRLSVRDMPFSRYLQGGTPTDTFNTGGAGLYGTMRDYSKILSALLNKGTSPVTQKQILQPSTVKDLFTNQLPNDPDFARKDMPTCRPELAYPASELYALCPPSKPQGWGLGVMLSPSVTGRSDTTGHWCGISNTFWWCDLEKGVAGIVGTQLLPFADLKAAQLWAGVESKVYEGLRKE